MSNEDVVQELKDRIEVLEKRTKNIIISIYSVLAGMVCTALFIHFFAQ